jgi:hypothetical protein
MGGTETRNVTTGCRGDYLDRRDETIRGSTKQRNEELHNLNPSPSIIKRVKKRMMRWVATAARKGKGNAYRILVRG